jgi:hypothetical protein
MPCLKDRDVASRYFDKLESELQGVQAEPLSLDEKYKKLEETIQKVATNTIGYTRKQANKEWFDKGERGKERHHSLVPSKSKSEEPRMLKNYPGQKRACVQKKGKAA